MNSLREWEEDFEQAVDVKKSYDLAKRMEEPKTNPVLGYRTAGSKAEWETCRKWAFRMFRRTRSRWTAGTFITQSFVTVIKKEKNTNFS